MMALLAFISTLWTHAGAVGAAKSVNIVFGGLVTTQTGWVPILLGWLGFSIIVFVLSLTIWDLLRLVISRAADGA